MKKAILHSSVEALEHRIAPASITFVDAAGDTVTIKTSKGTNDDLTAAATFAPSGSGQVLELLSLASNPVFQNTTLSITLANASSHVDIGFIDATGLDLGKVVVQGDLGRINAGDSHFQTKAIASLELGSLGAQGTTNQLPGGNVTSNIQGGVGALKVHGDVDGGFLVTGGTNGVGGSIGPIQIDGSVIGGTDTQTGYILAADAIQSVHVTGDVTGGTATKTGAIVAAGQMGAVTLGGNLIGGTSVAATNSGQIVSNAGMGPVTITGSIEGGMADSSGQLLSTSIPSVHIGNMIIGGAGLESGTVASSGFIKTIDVAHGIEGSSGEKSGSIRTAKGLGTVTLEGDLEGSSGSQSGIIGSDGPISTVVIHGSIFGSSGFESGAIGSSNFLGNVTVIGDVEGSSGSNSGQIVSSGALSSVVIQGSLVGSSGYQSGTIGAFKTIGSITIGTGTVSTTGKLIPSVFLDSGIVGSSGYQSGTILGGTNINKVVVNGDISGGFGFASGGIYAQGNLTTVVVNGSLFGGSTSYSGTIRSGGDMGTVTIQGDINGSGKFQAPAVLPGLIPQGEGAPNSFAGAVLSLGKINSVTVGGEIIGGFGSNSGVVETLGDSSSASDIGTVKVGGNIQGGFGSGSGAIFSAGHLGSVTLGTPGAVAQPELVKAKTPSGRIGSLVGGNGFGDATIGSNLGIGSILITGSVFGGSGDESGKIVTGGNLGSLTINGSLEGGSGNYNTTAKSGTPQVGEIYVGGTIKSVKIGSSIEGGDGSGSAEIRGGSIVSVIVGGNGFSNPDLGNVFGGEGSNSAAIVSEKGDIGFVHISGALESGGGFNSASILAARNLGTVETGGIFGSIENTVNITAGGVLLPKSNAQALAIKSVTVNGNAEFANILAGYDITGNAINADVQIGTVQTKANPSAESNGSMKGVNIVAGGVTGEDGSFGTFDDALITASNSPTILSSIAKIVVAGSFLSTGGEGDAYGFVAEHVTNVVVNGKTIVQNAGPHNDFTPADTSGFTTYINEFAPRTED